MFLAAPANLAPRESAVRCGGQWWLHRQGSSGEEEDTVRFRKVISSRGREAAIGSGGRAIDERPAYLRSSCSFTRGSWARGAPPPQLTPPRARGRGRGTVERRARSTPRAGGELHEHDSPATARSNKSGGGASLDSRRTVLTVIMGPRQRAKCRALVQSQRTTIGAADSAQRAGFSPDPGPAPSLSLRSDQERKNC